MRTSFNIIPFKLFFLTLIALPSMKGNCNFSDGISPRSYYFNMQGSDTSDGTIKNPWRSFARLKTLKFNAGDSVILESGHVFNGCLEILKHSNGNASRPIVITSVGKEPAIIDGGDGSALQIDSATHLSISNLRLRGSGRKNGNTANGISIRGSEHISVKDLSISGFQKSGLLVQKSSAIHIEKVVADDNGYAGITVNGKMYSKKDCSNIDILHCRTENNPGDPTELNNHSGSGIVVSQCTNMKIAYCTATNNGYDMPRKCNGPIGIWAWDADSLIIEHCLSYRNKTSKGGGDGGGFDLDGGVTNSIIQNCLSYENQGSGIGIFQFAYAGPWYNNIIRDNISINDGNVSDAGAGIYIWNSDTQDTMKNCYVYNNTIYNSINAAISFAKESANHGFVFYNNVLVGKNDIIIGDEKIAGAYFGNCWWSLSDGFNICGISDFRRWAKTYKQEQLGSGMTGLNLDPKFSTLAYTHVTKAENISTLDFEPREPRLKNGGVQLSKLLRKATRYNANPGNSKSDKSIGARF